MPTCADCGDSAVVIKPPLNIPQPCPACIAAGRVVTPAGHEMAPMEVLNHAVVVSAPEAMHYPAGDLTPNGMVMVGPGHVPGVGGVIRLVLVKGDGTATSVTMAAQGLAILSAMINGSARRLQSGEFDLPPAGVPIQ